ncbi:uncharacterized protein LOC110464997 isoform X2 [Mizuhopecten yessoensis]|uniref:uncharacterized protein LOC110464997 isoform X2 n=1 Tax=Mizuhopecten yessoensis TaxID=6573 RepID=UPI000B45CE94|nr:uncharacterized protein LOC110464997 isoform X2 [Mizuhopecten yessoensis]
MVIESQRNMKVFILALFFCWTCANAAAHLNCFGHVCDGHRSTCLVRNDHELTGRCEDAHVCDDHFLCSANHQPEHGPHHECCCTSQHCIDAFKVFQSTTPLTCFGQMCGSSHSICLVNKEEHGFTGRCEAPEHCHRHAKCTASYGTVHGPGHECCCMDQQCVDNLSSGTIQHSGSFLTCLGQTCDAHKPYCRLHSGDDHLTGHCMEEWQCMEHHRGICRSLSDTHGHEGCCCQHDTCIDTITGTHHASSSHTSSTSGIFSNDLQCSECSDIATQTCVHDHLKCGVNEVCKIKHTLQGKVSTQCESILQCATDKFADANQRQTLCCGSDQCTTNAVHNITSTGGHLTCPICNNQYLGDCHGDHLCAAGDSCMFEAQSGRLSTKCSPNCQQQGSNTFCCNDNYCVASTIKHFHQVSFVCPRCTDQSKDVCLASTITCSGSTAGCSIVRTERGFTAGCSSSFQDCMAVANTNSAACALSSPIDNTTHCQTCCQKDDADCIRQALSVHNTVNNMPTTGAPTMKASTVVQTLEPTTGAPTMKASTVVQTPEPTTGAQTMKASTVVQTPEPSTGAPTMKASTVVQTPEPTQGSTTGMPITVAPAMKTSPVVQTPQPTPGCPPFDLSCPSGCATYDVHLCPICDQSTVDCRGGTNAPVVTASVTTASPMITEPTTSDTNTFATSTAAPVVTSTPTATVAPKVCVDNDPQSCQALHGTLCTATDLPIHHLAVVTCAKSCGFCDEYLQLDATTTATSAPPVTTTPRATTTPKVCMDMDPDSCLRMEATLCPAADPNLHHMAVATCAKTCNFCDEFLHL